MIPINNTKRCGLCHGAFCMQNPAQIKDEINLCAFCINITFTFWIVYYIIICYNNYE